MEEMMDETMEQEFTQEQTEKLLQFQDMMGLEDTDQCRRTLEQHDWNIEAAVQYSLNEQEGIPNVPNLPASRPVQVYTAQHGMYSYIVAKPQPRGFLGCRFSAPQPRGFLGWSYYFIELPFRFTTCTLLDIFRFALQYIRRPLTYPAGDDVSFIQFFEEKYGRSHPIFYQGTYSEALNDAKRDQRYLLVYLHGEQHQDTDEFCRYTLCAEEVITFLNQEMLVWACSASRPEGVTVSQALQDNHSFPFLAMVMQKERKMTVVGRLEGLIQPEDLIKQLTIIMEANQPYLTSERLEREERNQTQVLRQEQDEAYLASLRADQEKNRRKREEEEQKLQEEEKVRQSALAQETRRWTLEEQKERKSECLPPEPPADHPESIKIGFKLPNDTRVERRFLFGQSLTVIYDYLFSLKDTPERFQIVTNFPRRVLPCLPTEEQPNPPKLREVGLSRSEFLFVQDLTDE